MRKILLSMAMIGSVGGTSVAYEPRDLENGRLKYEETCVACHGEKGKPTMPGIPDFTSRKGPLKKPNGKLVTSITEGIDRPEADLAMPPLGGNPDLTEKDVRDILSYMRKTFKRR